MLLWCVRVTKLERDFKLLHTGLWCVRVTKLERDFKYLHTVSCHHSHMCNRMSEVVTG